MTDGMLLGPHYWQRCGDCGKMVRLKPWLGTLHFCLTPEESVAREYASMWGHLPLTPPHQQTVPYDMNAALLKLLSDSASNTPPTPAALP